MVKDKKGAVMFEWIFGLTFLFTLGLLYIVFNYALVDNLMPIYEDMIPDDSPAKDQVLSDSNEWLSYWNILPIIFVLLIGVYWLVSVLRKENNGYQPRV